MSHKIKLSSLVNIIRTNKNISTKKIADLTGFISEQSIEDYERGAKQISLDDACTLSNILNIAPTQTVNSFNYEHNQTFSKIEGVSFVINIVLCRYLSYVKLKKNIDDVQIREFLLNNDIHISKTTLKKMNEDCDLNIQMYVLSNIANFLTVEFEFLRLTNYICSVVNSKDKNSILKRFNRIIYFLEKKIIEQTQTKLSRLKHG